MALTVTAIAPTRRLTRKEHVKRELTVPAGDDALLEQLVDEASAAIHNHCNLAFGREAVTETFRAYGATEVQLSRTPLILVTAVRRDLDVVTDYAIESRDQGTLYRRAGWEWTVQGIGGFTGRQRFPGFGVPLPQSEEPLFAADYLAGYILPPQWLVDATTVSVAAADQSFNDSANGFPAQLKAGEVLVARGFTDPKNNGRFLITGTPTAGKVQVVGAALATEAAGSARSVAFEPPPDCRPFEDVERACIETIKAWFSGKGQDPEVVEKQVGALRIRRTESDDAMTLPLPPRAVGLLKPWRRVA